ncbi:CheR family methyltransferase [Deinococcus sedimenti]|uniref:CheR family methyltransferase n=1 Tax=Deinococcus sedimenti TaxID=1867090 RepID=UPI00166CD395|nr:CheR family methyltransferase [Deinococcus sedimenti]
MTLEDLLERTAGLRWTAPLDRLARSRLQRLTQAHGSPDALLQVAAARADLAADVAAAFTVGETWFHRFGEQLDAAALALRALGRPVRGWSAGCSTGEEVWALLGACLHAGVDARVLGTDLNPAALAAASDGAYPRRALRAAPPERVTRVFTAGGPRVQVRPEVRARAQFQVHNLLRDPPGRGFDVIACRNVLIYFTPAAARAVGEQLTSALAPGGLLLLAPSDPRPPAVRQLEQVRVGGTVLLRRPLEAPPVPAPPGPTAPLPVRRDPGPASAPRPAPERPDLAGARQRAFADPEDAQVHLDLAQAFLLAGQPARAASSLRGAQAALDGQADSWQTVRQLARLDQLRREVRAAGGEA